MTSFELLYICAEPLMSPLYFLVRRRLQAIIRECGGQASILDVGGRKSHYTAGVPAAVYITDLPRKTAVQQKLHLGVNSRIVGQIRQRRSNVRGFVYDDMTHSALRERAFGCVVAVEVLEHVEDDVGFIREVHRVLRDGGVFLMTTPNGDAVQNTNPDHKRHYTRAQLQSLLASHFEAVRVEYALAGGQFRRWGLQSWSVQHPVQTMRSAVGNLVTLIQSSAKHIRERPNGTRHLLAEARK